jgi:hypothetical protein
LLGPS